MCSVNVEAKAVAISFISSSPPSPIMTSLPSISTPLTQTYPSTSELSRSDLESLARAIPQSRPSQQEDEVPSNQSSESQHDSAFFEAFFDSLPQVRELFDRHEKLLEGNERLAGELALGRSRNGILRIEMRKLGGKRDKTRMFRANE